MMTSSQIAQANHHAFSMGYGANAGTGGYESMTGFTPFGHGAGSQFGTSALTGANSMVGTASTVGMGAYFASMGLNKMFGASRLASGLHGIGAATGMTLPMAATFGLMMPAQLALSGMASGAQQVAQTQNVMDQNFGSRVNMGGRFGFGVSRQDALNMTEAIRSLKSVPEMMTSMGELQSVLGKVSSMGILQGVQSASEFKNKFTSMVGALREISKNLGSTLEETLPFLQSSVRQGFLDTDEIRRNVQQSASATSVGIGMSRQRMFGLQEQGANMLRGMGADSRIGGMGARDVASSISVAQSMGVLSQQDITRITGKVGEAGVADLSGRFMSAQAKLFQQRGAGRFITAALAERDDAGMFTGRLNEDMLRKLRNNQLSGAELMKMGHSNLSGMSDEQALSFENAMSRGMGAEAGALAGMSGGATAMNAILEEMGADNQQAKRRILQSITGMNQAETDAMLRLARNAADVQSQRNSEMIQATVRDRSVAFFKENMTVEGAMHHATTRMRKNLVDPFTSYGASASTRVSERFDDVMDSFITGSSARKLNMVLNPFEIAKNAAGTLFGNASYRSSAARGRASLGRMFSGQGREMGDLGNIDLTGGIREKGSFSMSGIAGAGATGLTAGAMALGMLTPLGIAMGLGAGVSGLVDAYSGFDEEEVSNIFGNVRTGKGLNALMTRRVSQSDASDAATRLMRALREEGISAGSLSSTDLESMLDIANSLGGGGQSGLSVIAAAAQADSMEGELAGELRDRINSGLLAKAIQGEGAIGSTAEAKKRMEDIFDPGGLDNFLSGVVGHEAFAGTEGGAYFASAAAKSIMEGSDEGRSSLIRILKDKRLRGSLSNFAGRRGSIERLMKREGIKGISVEDMMGLAGDLSTAYSEDTFNLDAAFGLDADYYLDIVARDLASSDKILQAEDDRQARQSLLQTFTKGFSDKELGRNVFNAMSTGGGLLKNIGNISQMLSGDVEGRVAKSLKSSMGRNNLVGINNQKDAIEKIMKTLGVNREQIDAAQLFDSDGALSDRERSLASQLIGFGRVANAELSVEQSRVGQRANAMGVDVESIRDKAFKESLEAQATTLRAHTDFVRTVGDVVPALRRSAENTEIINTGAGN